MGLSEVLPLIERGSYMPVGTLMLGTLHRQLQNT